MDIQDERETQLYNAILAQKAMRYDDMVEHMKKIAELGVPLTLEERTTLHYASKTAISKQRTAWKYLHNIEMDSSTTRGNGHHINLLKSYRRNIERDISQMSTDTLKTINQYLLPNSSSPEATIFYRKMKGDFLRYLAEIRIGTEMKEVAEQSSQEYQAAAALSELYLPPFHKYRLGIGLNYSILQHHIMNSPKRAYNTAKKTLDEALSEWHKLDEDVPEYGEIKFLMLLLNDNIRLCDSEVGDEGDQDEGQQSNPAKPEEERRQEPEP